MTEQLRVTESPAMMGEGGEEVRERVGDTVWGKEYSQQDCRMSACVFQIYIVHITLR